MLASFELDSLSSSVGAFGVSVRSGAVRVEIVSVNPATRTTATATGASTDGGGSGGHLVTVDFYAGPQGCVSVRGKPPCTAPPMPPPPVNATVIVLPGETLDIRVLVE